MLFFIPWVVFLLLIIIAVPIAAMLDGRKARSSYDSYDSGMGGEMDDESLEPLEDAGDGVLEEGSIQEGGQDPDDPFGTGAPDDFSAFEEEFN